jgi:hypothetical protein
MNKDYVEQLLTISCRSRILLTNITPTCLRESSVFTILTSKIRPPNILSSMMMAAGNGMSQITGSMVALQTSTKNFLDKHGIESTPAKLKKFPAIANVLAKDKSDLLNPMFMQSNGTSSKSAEPVKQTRKKREPRDPNAPKRPQTAYFLYLAEHRDALSKKNPGISGKNVSALLTTAWNEKTSDEEQQVLFKIRYS